MGGFHYRADGLPKNCYCASRSLAGGQYTGGCCHLIVARRKIRRFVRDWWYNLPLFLLGYYNLVGGNSYQANQQTTDRRYRLPNAIRHQAAHPYRRKRPGYSPCSWAHLLSIGNMNVLTGGTHAGILSMSAKCYKRRRFYSPAGLGLLSTKA